MNIKRILLFIGLFVFFFIEAYSNNNQVIRRVKVSCQDLNLDSINKRTESFVNTRLEVKYLTKMLSFARKRHDVKLESEILYSISKNYFNRYSFDSLNYWVDKSIPILLENKQYNIYFNLCSLSCIAHIYAKEFDLAFDKSREIYYYAKKNDSTYGLIASYENFGVIYMETYRYHDAVKSFKDGLQLLEKSKNPNYSYIVQMDTYIIENYIRYKFYKSAKFYVDKMYNDLELWKKSSNDVCYNRCMWLLMSYNANISIALNQPEQAKKYIEQSKKYMSGVNDLYVESSYNIAVSSYYKLIKDYDKALKYLDKIKDVGSSQKMKMKADILLLKGYNNEAAKLYSKVVEGQDSIINNDFTKQITQLREAHEIDQLKIQNNELEIQSRTYKLKIISVITALLLLFTFVGMIYTIRIRRMKNQLIKSDKLLKLEKRQLEVSQKELVIAKEKADASNKFKDTFLANMSHEVRTPLNAIVGFSEIICDLYSDNVETKEFTSLIKMNSDNLLKLINDTVDISLLQTNQLEFTFEECEINDICVTLINRMKIFSKPDVTLSLVSPNSDGFYFNTDYKRIQQVIGNLLLNSIKFTDKGYIKLKYDIDKENNKIIFIVEDTGKGINPEMRTRIFESFQKVDSFTQGIGLGLTLCNIIAQKLNGRINLDTSYTNGTKMIFIHPII